METFGEHSYTFSKLDASKKNVFGRVYSQNDPLHPMFKGLK
jgi:hypothetical protein